MTHYVAVRHAVFTRNHEARHMIVNNPAQQDAVVEFTCRDKQGRRMYSSSVLRAGESMKDWRARIALDYGANDLAVHRVQSLGPRIR